MTTLHLAATSVVDDNCSPGLTATDDNSSPGSVHLAATSVVDDNCSSTRYPGDVLASSDRRNYQCVDDEKNFSELSRKTAPADNGISLSRLVNSRRISGKAVTSTRVVKATTLARKKMKSEGSLEFCWTANKTLYARFNHGHLQSYVRSFCPKSREILRCQIIIL